jgi:hypothetical protein
MLHTEKTDQAYKLLKTYARTPEQDQAVDTLYVDILAESSNEDRVIIYLLGLVLDGLRYGNWFWNMPPNAKQAIPAVADYAKRMQGMREPGT